MWCAVFAETRRGYRELGASSAPPSSAPSVRLGESRRSHRSRCSSRDARVTWASQDEVLRAKGCVCVCLSRFERSRLYHVHRAESTRRIELASSRDAFEPKPLCPRPASPSARDAPPRPPFHLRATLRRASVPRSTPPRAAPRCAPIRRREGVTPASFARAWPLDTIDASARDGCAQRTRGGDANRSRPRLTHGTPAPPAQSPAVTDVLLFHAT